MSGLRLLSIFIVAVVVANVFADSVLDYTEMDFASKIAEHEVALVKFYAPWCGHCKRLAPDYEKAASKLLTNDPPISLIKVDCTKDQEVCEKNGVSGYPTLKIFRNGESSEYDGPREAEGIVKYMRDQTGPSSKELKSLADFEKFIASDDNVVVGFFENESKLKDSFHKVADTERDRFRFGYTSNKEVLEKVGLTDDISVFVPTKLHNKFEENQFRYDGNYDTDKIKDFLIHDTNGLVGVRTQSNLFQFTRQPLCVVYYAVDYVKDPKGSHYWRNRVLKVSSNYKNRKAHFAVSNKDDFAQEIQQAGITVVDKPVVVCYTENGKYPINKEFSVENLQQFVEEVLSGKAEPYVKSEPVPESQGNLKVVVGKNFKELITDADKDVLIEFYAPWCGHCKQLAPKYEELADNLADEDVVIAKLDATANDVPPLFKVQGYPTIYWLPKNNKHNPVPYQGGRELKDFIKFIAQHSTDGLSGYDRKGKKVKQDL